MKSIVHQSYTLHPDNASLGSFAAGRLRTFLFVSVAFRPPLALAALARIIQLTDMTIMDGLAMERMLFAIEGSLKITGRVQFFLWSQGALQGILPHDMLLCVFGDFASSRFRYDVFSQIKVEPHIIERIADPVDGLLQRVIGDWMEQRHGACVYSVAGTVAKTKVGDTIPVHLHRCGFENALAHGAREISGSEGSFFVFFRSERHVGANDPYLLDMIMPHLHMALYRMLPNECVAAANEISPEGILSVRELEVLRWVREGKTNQEIGQVLDISPLTVKNHVQKILRKLNVSNRAQAVAKGQSAHMFGTQHSARLSNPAMSD